MGLKKAKNWNAAVPPRNDGKPGEWMYLIYTSGTTLAATAPAVAVAALLCE